jgi:hypothetical protein
MVTPYLANARFADKFVRPANAWTRGEAAGERDLSSSHPVITRVYSDGVDSSPVLHIDVTGQDQVVSQLSRQRTLLGYIGSRRGNMSPLVESIGKQGNTEPIFTFVTRLRDTITGATATLLSAGDGARRTTASHEGLRLLTDRDPYVGILHWQNGMRELDEKSVAQVRAHLSFKGVSGLSSVAEIWQAKDENRETYLARLSDEQKRIHRYRTLRSRLIVGFEPAYPDAQLSIAVEEYISRQHMLGSMPEPWTEDGQLTKAYWVAVESLFDRGDLLSDQELALLLGNLERADAAKLGIEYADQAFARIVSIVAHNDKRRYTMAVHGGLRKRGIDVRGSSPLSKRVAIAIQGALSYFPVSDEGRHHQQVVKALIKGFDDEAYYRIDWAPRTTDDIDVLVTEATEDVPRFARHSRGTRDHFPSPAGVALMALALPHLVTVPESDRRLTQTGRGGKDNVTTADPDQILLNMLRTVGGVRQLGEVIKAGRKGRSAPRIAPDGSIVESTEKDEKGRDPIADDVWLRTQWSAVRGATVLAHTSDERLAVLSQNVYKEAIQWAKDVDELFKVDDGAGRPLIQTAKFDRKDFKDLRQKLGDATDRLAAVLSDEVAT